MKVKLSQYGGRDSKKLQPPRQGPVVKRNMDRTRMYCGSMVIHGEK